MNPLNRPNDAPATPMPDPVPMNKTPGGNVPPGGSTNPPGYKPQGDKHTASAESGRLHVESMVQGKVKETAAHGAKYA